MTSLEAGEHARVSRCATALFASDCLMSLVLIVFLVFHDKYRVRVRARARLSPSHKLLKETRRVHGQFNMMFCLTWLSSAFYFSMYMSN